MISEEEKIGEEYFLVGLRVLLECSVQILSQCQMNFLDQNRQPRNGNGTAPPFQPHEQGIDKGDVHMLMMVIGWLAAGNIGLWSLAFKQYRCSIYVHFFCMAMLTILVWMAGFLAITEWGINAKIGQFHIWLGISIMIIIMIQAIGGAVTWLLQKCAKVEPRLVYIMNWIHRILGFILLILATVEILVVTREHKLKIFIPVLVISVVSWVAYLLQRFLRPKMQGYSALSTSNSPLSASRIDHRLGSGLPMVSNTQDLARYNGDYFIFADKVYDLHNVLANHPGGYELIKNIRGREVDRYVYGSEPLESVDKMYLHRHTAGSMKLAGEPIAEFTSSAPFSGFRDVNEVYTHHVNAPAKSPYLYAPYLAPKLDPISFSGYHDISQLGKYFAVTINNSLTRLYSVVNFLQPSNLDLMRRIAGRSFENLVPGWGRIGNGTQVPLTQRGFATSSIDNGIPLLIKKYKDGNFTSKLLDKNFRGKIKVSKPLGRGLNLHETPPGQLIFLSGGTGLNPFSDTIDLLFKQLLVSRRHTLSNEILNENPILRSSPLLNKYNFTLYHSMDNAEELNELTAYQLNALAQNKIMKTYVKGKGNLDELLRSFPHLERVQARFEKYVGDFASRLDKISQIFVCGPPAMSAALVRAFSYFNIPNFRYKIL